MSKTNASICLKNRIREVETLDKATNERKNTLRAVNLRASDFASRDEYKAYKLRIARLAEALKAYDEAETDTSRFETKAVALENLQSVYDFLSTVAKIEAYTAQEVEIKYIKRLQAARRLNKEAREIEVSQKSLSAFAALVEDVIYFRLNGLKLPMMNTSKTVAAVLEKAAEEEKQAAEAEPAVNAKPRTVKSPRAKKAAEAVA